MLQQLFFRSVDAVFIHIIRITDEIRNDSKSVSHELHNELRFENIGPNVLIESEDILNCEIINEDRQSDFVALTAANSPSNKKKKGTFGFHAR